MSLGMELDQVTSAMLLVVVVRTNWMTAAIILVAVDTVMTLESDVDVSRIGGREGQ